MAGVTVEEDGEGAEGAETDDKGECPCDGCNGVLIDVFDIPAFLRHHDPPPDVSGRMVAAHDWRMGQVMAPPGMRSPTTKEEAREAFETLL